jgi:hypothetical protein
MEMIKYFLNRIIPSVASNEIDIPTLTGLGVAMGLLKKDRLRTALGYEDYFAPKNTNAIEHPYHHIPLLNLPSLRAEVVSALLSIPDARAVITSRLYC